MTVHIGEIARRCRHIMQLTQEEVSERLELTGEYYARIERGQSMPSIQTFCKMAAVFGISANVLLGLREIPDSYTGPPWQPIVEDEAANMDRLEALVRARRKKLIERLRCASPEVLHVVDWILKEIGRITRAARAGKGSRGPARG